MVQLCNLQTGQRSGLKVKQFLEGLTIRWDSTRGQCVCNVAGRGGKDRKGEVGEMKGRKRTAENKAIQKRTDR